MKETTMHTPGNRVFLLRASRPLQINSEGVNYEEHLGHTHTPWENLLCQLTEELNDATLR
jgi:hypothetical protein